MGASEDAELERLAAVDDIVTAARAAQPGVPPDVEALCAQHPDFAAEIRATLGGLDSLERAVDPERLGGGGRPLPAAIGPYEVLGEVGRGGMGIVYEAQDRTLGRRVAIKVLPRAVADRPSFVERFRREAQAAARLEHPNVVPVYGTGHDAAGHHLVMKYVDGVGLDEAMPALRAIDGDESGAGDPPGGPARRIARRLTTVRLGVDSDSGSSGAASDDAPPASLGRAYHRNVARIGLGVAGALAHAHAHGVLHRDVKPGNILIDGRGHVWVTDFGLAKLDENEDLTREGDLVGTLRYMAPEQFEGHAEARSDIYALGLVLYELLTLERAQSAEARPALVHEVLYGVPRSPDRVRAGVPSDLARVVMKALEKLPEERYRTADEMAMDLRAFLDGRPIAARLPSALYLTRLAVRRNRVLFGAIAALLVALAVGAVLYGVQLVAAAKEESRLAYRGQLVAAAAALQNADTPTAEFHLEACPEDLRAWEWQHLSASVDQSLRTLAKVGHPVHLIEPLEGDRLRVMHRGGVVTMGPSGTEAIELPGAHERRAEALSAWERDGRCLVFHYRTGLWEGPASGGGFSTSPAHRSEVPDGWRRLPVGIDAVTAAGNMEAGVVVVAERNGLLFVVDLDRFEVVRSCPTGQMRVTDVVLSGRGDVCWVSSGDGQLVEWDVATLTPKVLATEPSGLTCLALSADEERVAAGCGDRSIRVFGRSGEAPVQWVGHSRPVSAMAFSPSGDLLVSAGLDHTLRLWDSETGRTMQVLSGLSRRPGVVTFDPDERRVYTGTAAGVVKEWRLGPGGGRATLSGGRGDVVGLGWSEAGDRFAAGARDGTVRIFDGASLRLDVLLLGHAHELNGLGWHDGDRRLLGTDRGGRVIDFDARTGAILWRARVDGVASEPSFGPDRAHVYLVGRGGEVQKRDALTGEVLALASDLEDAPHCVLASPAGDRVYVGTVGGAVVAMDANSLDELGRAVVHGRVVTSIEPRRLRGVDGLVTVSLDGTLAFVDGSTLEVTGRTRLGGEGHSGYADGLDDVAVSPDGRLVAVASHSRLIKLVDAATGDFLLDLAGHLDWARRVAFSPDGTRLLSSSSDETVRVWDTVSSEERFRAIDARLELEEAAAARLARGRDELPRDPDDIVAALAEVHDQPVRHAELAAAMAAVLHQNASRGVIGVIERRCLGPEGELYASIATQFALAFQTRAPASYDLIRLMAVVRFVRRQDGLVRGQLGRLEARDPVRARRDIVVSALRAALDPEGAAPDDEGRGDAPLADVRTADAIGTMAAERALKR